MSIRDQIALNHKLQNIRKQENPKEKSLRRAQEIEKQLPEELINPKAASAKSGILSSVLSNMNSHKMNKFDKALIEQARRTPEKKDNKKRFDQLLVKQYVRNVLADDDENAIFSEPEEGDEDFDGQVKETDKELIMKYKGNLPKGDKKDTDENQFKMQQGMRNANNQKYATQTSSPSRVGRQQQRRTPIMQTGLYDLDVKSLEEEISKLKPNNPKQNSCFTSPSRENLFNIDQKNKVAPPVTKYRPNDPKIDKTVIVKIDKAPLDRQKYVVKPSPCISDLKTEIVKPNQAKPGFFEIMKDVKMQEKQFLEGIEDERFMQRQKYEKVRLRQI